MAKLCMALKVTAALLHLHDKVLGEDGYPLLLGGDRRHLDPYGEDFHVHGHLKDKAEVDPL